MTINFYIVFGVFLILYEFAGYPRIDQGEYPKLEEATVVDGVLVRQKVSGKYTSEWVIVEDHGQRTKAVCSSLGNYCFKNDEWDSYIGRKTRIWVWNGFLIQMEIEGKILSGMSYEAMMRLHTFNPFFVLFKYVVAPLLLLFLLRTWLFYRF